MNITKEVADIVRDALILLEAAEFRIPGSRVPEVNKRLEQVEALADGLRDGNFKVTTVDKANVDSDEPDSS